jgi:multicomponent K+:H+ antiporter subunit F
VIETALNVCLGAVALALALTAWRALRGPEPTDRVLALDLLYVNLVALVVLLGLKLESNVLFEAAVVVALLGFIATAALARYLARGSIVE